MPMNTAQIEHNKQARGHIAAALRTYMDRNEMTVREFNEKVLKIAGRSVVTYAWLAARSVPSEGFIPALSKALNKPAKFFQPREVVEKSNSEASAQEAVAEVLNDPSKDFAEVVHALHPKAVAEPHNRAIVRARNPRHITLERTRKALKSAVSDIVDDGEGNSLTYWSNGDGSATVTMVFNAPREAAHRVFIALAELGVDAPRKDENSD